MNIELSQWSHYYPPLVQRIIHYTVDWSIGTQQDKVIFRDMVNFDLAMDFPEGTTGKNPEDCLVKRREAILILVQTTQDYQKSNMEKS